MLSIFTVRPDDTGIQALFGTHHKEAAMVTHLVQRGQIERAAVGTEHIPSEASRLGKVILLGGRVRGSHDAQRSTLEQVQSAMQFDRSGLDRIEAAGEYVPQGIVDGKRTPILYEHAAEFTQGLTVLETQYFQGPFVHYVTEPSQEKGAASRFGSLIVAGFVGYVHVP